MFIGHYGPAYALKAAKPRVPLWVLFLAVQVLDILISVFLRVGWEKMRVKPGMLGASDLDLYYIPLSHGLPAAIGWSLLAALIYRVLRAKDGHAAAAAVALAVFSHWIADFLTHPADLPLWGDSYKVGLGLWAYPVFSLFLEAGLFVGGFILYLRASEPRNLWGSVAPWVFVVALIAIQVAGHANGDSRPRDLNSVTLFGLIVFPVLAALAAVLERTRTMKGLDNQAG